MKRIAVLVGVFLAGATTMWMSGQVGNSWEKTEYVGHGITVIRARLAPHQKTEKHSHSGRYQIILTDGDMRTYGSDGTVKDAHVTKGTAVWTDAMTHISENIGSTPFEEIDIIPDDQKSSR